jgi:hypothetical protein
MKKISLLFLCSAIWLGLPSLHVVHAANSDVKAAAVCEQVWGGTCRIGNCDNMASDGQDEMNIGSCDDNSLKTTCCLLKAKYDAAKGLNAANTHTNPDNPFTKDQGQAPVKPSPYSWTPPPVKLQWSFYGNFLSKDFQNRCLGLGNCRLDDILYIGAAFANFLMALGAAAMFVSFVYGGAMYMLSFGDSGKVEKGKNAIRVAVIGMIIMMCSWAIVNYVVNSIGVRVL